MAVRVWLGCGWDRGLMGTEFVGWCCVGFLRSAVAGSSAGSGFLRSDVAGSGAGSGFRKF